MNPFVNESLRALEQGDGKEVRLGENSDPNHRPLRVIAFLAAHPLDSFSLTDIARELELSKGSAHRVLTALTEAGFANRHPRHKTYSLGLALVAIGQAALERHPGIQVTRREMARLAAELNVGCGAVAVAGQEYVLLAREGAPWAQDGLMLVGERRLLIPPIGICHMAWRKSDEVADYLARGEAYLSPELRQRVEESLPVIRHRGYAMAANGDGMRRLRAASVLAGGVAPGLADMPAGSVIADEYQLLDTAAAARGVNYISAPVFAADGSMCHEVVMSALPEGLSAAEIERFAARLCRAADIVTAETRGRAPKPW